METIDLLMIGFAQALTWQNLLFCLIGVSIGMFVGVMPGLGPVAGTAILIPLTYGMDPTSAIIMLSGIYYGAMYGGTITSVLINIPGEAASVITCLDGHQLAKQGRAGVALGVSAIGSFVGGITALLGLTFIAPPLSQFALRFGPPEFFALMLLGLMMLIGLMGKSLVKGFIAAAFGLILSLVGIDPISGAIRFTSGVPEFLGGIDFVIVAMGLFGISEILMNAENRNSTHKPEKVRGLFPRKGEWSPTWKSIGRGTGLGFFIGLIPGANAVLASLASYAMEKRVAKNPERFGKGAIEGVAGPETANNACSGSALIPLFTLGLPSSPTVAVIMGALIMHGLQPGPQLFNENSEFAWAVIASMFIGNIILLIMNLPLANMWAKIAQIPYNILLPLIIMFTLVGAYTVRNNVFDVGVMIVFGLIGYLMKKLDIPIAATVLTLVLGAEIEASLLQSLAISNGSFSIFFSRPIAAVLLVITTLILFFSILAGVKKKKDVLSTDLEI
ncbi:MULTISPECIES: tripartite tricarboxylate transporter permease [unclassified Paenibacillus]|uniref:tripartite tricarboxylate transporter permease n=1 Tax=unclassified Paenibacillus TaxID=185978 RepID=UPI001AE6D04F|nr:MULTISPECIES: tripartite tricarboxylate transporter permease [unclassified Paenibacillus]MBP1157016.1 putative tricarboxylic transport membrane protein [Paenibacillus sp. PvP091]MBP1172245.1 putative tricarboxylic transport membrane protein [Paenibacillus sp. PvR098]MBP2438626.1 putative tricarboxylic transport membrane protein [Paenibacillus sp. PvP052]